MHQPARPSPIAEARKWIDTAAEKHAIGSWSDSAAAARIGLALAQLAVAEAIAALMPSTARQAVLEGLSGQPQPAAATAAADHGRQR